MVSKLSVYLMSTDAIRNKCPFICSSLGRNLTKSCRGQFRERSRMQWFQFFGGVNDIAIALIPIYECGPTKADNCQKIARNLPYAKSILRNMRRQYIRPPQAHQTLKLAHQHYRDTTKIPAKNGVEIVPKKNQRIISVEKFTGNSFQQQ